MNDKAKLFAKMAKVMGELARIPKNGHNNHFNYDFAIDADVSDAIRSKLAENGIAFFASMVDCAQSEVGGKSVRTIATFEFTFACTETGESMTCRWSGESIGSDDKGVNKASTAALKYFLLKTFIISTGDDPDADAGTPNTAPAQNTAPARNAAPRDVMADKTTAGQFWAHWSGSGMTSSDILTALGVERLSDYPGSRQQADAAMQAYIASNTTNNPLGARSSAAS